MAVAKTRRGQRGRPVRTERSWLMPIILSCTLLGAGAVLAGAYHYLSQPGRLPLRVVEVQGKFQRLEAGAIERVVLDSIDGGFFSCDMQKLREAVLGMPWVEDVSIRRGWPDRLSMVVTEQVPLARWGDDALISVGATIFRPQSLDGFSSLVRLSGPKGSAQRVVAFFQAAVPVARARGLQISEIELDQRRHWWLRFDNALTVSLGRENVDYRLAQFFRVYPSLVAEPQRLPERVDMRYAHGFAVRWREVPVGETAHPDAKPQEKV
jgi:cell division protein FtsQ